MKLAIRILFISMIGLSLLGFFMIPIIETYFDSLTHSTSGTDLTEDNASAEIVYVWIVALFSFLGVFLNGFYLSYFEETITTKKGKISLGIVSIILSFSLLTLVAGILILLMKVEKLPMNEKKARTQIVFEEIIIEK